MCAIRAEMCRRHPVYCSREYDSVKEGVSKTSEGEEIYTISVYHFQ
jgi:hypothetical protein